MSKNTFFIYQANDEDNKFKTGIASLKIAKEIIKKWHKQDLENDDLCLKYKIGTTI